MLESFLYKNYSSLNYPQHLVAKGKKLDSFKKIPPETRKVCFFTINYFLHSSFFTFNLFLMEAHCTISVSSACLFFQVRLLPITQATSPVRFANGMHGLDAPFYPLCFACVKCHRTLSKTDRLIALCNFVSQLLSSK